MLKANLLDYKVTEVGVMHLPRLDGISTGARPSVIIRTIKEVFDYRKNILKKKIKKLILPYCFNIILTSERNLPR